MPFWRQDVIQPALDAGVDAEIREQETRIHSSPADPIAHFALASLAHFRGQTEKAIQHFEKAIELDPSYAAPHVSLGRIYAVRGDYDRAWEYAQEAARRGDSTLLDQLERYPNLAKIRQ
ncbi:MAG TPA: tetratricopeptide repeat protein [Terriglobia bacterium]|nr:tetratricopeptide repeat protein [Terriglobia bacterium]